MPSFSSITLPIGDTGFVSPLVLAPFDRRNNTFIWKEQATSAGYNLGYKALAASMGVQVMPSTKNQPLHKVRTKIVQPLTVRAADGVTATNASANQESIEILYMSPAAAWVSETSMLNKLFYALIKNQAATGQLFEKLFRDQEGMTS